MSHFSAWTGGEEPGTGRGKAEGGPTQGIAFCSPQSIVEFSLKEQLQQYEASFKLSLREILCASKSGSAMAGCRQEVARRQQRQAHPAGGLSARTTLSLLFNLFLKKVLVVLWQAVSKRLLEAEEVCEH